jgi:DNA-binding transcriptional regulator GbsR (MarR family)
MKKKDLIEQVSNMVSFFERLLSERKDEEIINIAICLNEMERKAGQMAEPSAYAEGYKDAIDELKQSAGIKDTVYELYSNPSQ